VLQSFVKTSSCLFQRYQYYEISGQSSSLKATGYEGYNLSMNISKFGKIFSRTLVFLSQSNVASPT
jgi:hypothetical protein